jgi:hypothetical protein
LGAIQGIEKIILSRQEWNSAPKLTNTLQGLINKSLQAIYANAARPERLITRSKDGVASSPGSPFSIKADVATPTKRNNGK